MVVQHNISAMTANRYYGVNNKGLAGSLEKLASGYSINKAGDNAAGLAVSEKMRAQIGGLTQASKNAEDGISMVQTFEGALQETDSILQRMRTLAVQSANGSYQDDVDREAMQLEFDQLNDELNQIADTDFNGVVILNGGKMADGTKADGKGKIDYSTATREAKQLGSAGGMVKAIDTAGYQGTNAETVTFTAKIDDNGKVEWTKSGDALGTVTNSTGNNGAAGGFSYDGAVVVVDTEKVVAGDTITIEFGKNSAAVGTLPGTIGTNVDLGTTGGDKTTGAAGVTAASFATTGGSVTSQDMADAYNALNGVTVESVYAADDTDPSGGTKVNGVTIPTAANTYAKIGETENGSITIDKDKKIYFTDKSGTRNQLGVLSLDSMANGAKAAGKVTTTINLGQATYKPASDGAVTLVEPKSQVSASNSNDASTATLTYKDSLTLQVGARTKDSVNFTFNYTSNGLGDLKANMNCSSRTDGLGTADLSIKTQKDANAAIDKIDNALNKVSMVRATFGSVQNRLEHKINNIDTNTENLTAAESRIRDTQMDKEMMKFTSAQILSQASQSMLAQANSLPQGVLQLLG